MNKVNVAEKCDIRLLPHVRTIQVNKNSNLLQVLCEHNIFLRSDCGGRGSCGKCRVYVVSDESQRVEYNSCQVAVEDDMTIEVPISSMLSSEVIGKAPIKLPEQFTHRLSNTGSRTGFGIAVDLGTTTIAIYLVKLATADILASLSLKNPQTLYGDDVMSRIARVAEKEENLAHLQNIVVKTIELGTKKLREPHGVAGCDLKEMVVVGNPTMIHLFLGVNPRPMGVAPYLPVICESRVSASRSLGFEELELDVHTIPNISGFLGGDLLSAALAANIDLLPPGSLLIDIGTNGELILRAESGLYATSCATGPAFEGATLSCGMQAISGAVDDVSIKNRETPPHCNIVSRNGFSKQQKPAGICGSGIISGIAEMFRKGVVESSGAFSSRDNIPHLLKAESGGRRYLLFKENESESGKEISISQKDIRAVQLGKGALITGIDLLLRKAGVNKIEQIILAGAFGSHLQPEDLIAIGMLPEIEISRVVAAGNLAGAGAIMLLCDKQLRSKVNELARSIVNINLAGDPEFQTHFVNSLAFQAL